jgi:predicted dehydrogenase
LADRAVELVLNLTNPRSHFEVTNQCLRARKHVYSEKPLAMRPHDAMKLIDVANEHGVRLGSAPCSLLGETAQTVWHAIRKGLLGQVRLVYANFDDGMIAPKGKPWFWRNETGVPWPAKDEFEVGCTYEHAGYLLTWLAAFFGPARSVTAFSSCRLPDKGIPVDVMAPDFSVGCIEYADGIVARVTCGLVAPRDKSLMIVGDDAVLTVGDVRNDRSPVYIRPEVRGRWHSIIERTLNSWRLNLESLLPLVPWTGGEIRLQRKLPLVRKPPARLLAKEKQVDFFRGPAEMAGAIRERRQCRLSAELGAHITELIEALQYPQGGQKQIDSRFPAIEPLPCSA